MKATIPQTQVARLGVQQVDIGELSAGPLAIGKLVLDDLNVGLSTGAARLQNLRVTVSVELSLDWRVGVTIDWLGDWSWRGTIDLGAQSVTVPLGNVNVPGLQSLSIDVGTLSVSNVSAVIGAIRNLRLGALVAEQVQLDDVEVPAAGFQLAGLALAGAQLDGVGVPRISAATATAGRVHGQALPLGAMTIPNLALPTASVGQIASDALDAGATSNPLVFSADAGVLRVSLSVTPGAHMHADELRLSNVRASASVGQIELQNVVLPYDVLDVKLSQLGLETIDVPTLEVG